MPVSEFKGAVQTSSLKKRDIVYRYLHQHFASKHLNYTKYIMGVLEDLVSLCVNLALLSLLQNGLPFPSQCLPASSFLQQVD